MRERSPQTLSEADRRLVAAWAADCVERVLGFFEAEAPDDDRPRALVSLVDGIGVRARRAGSSSPTRRRRGGSPPFVKFLDRTTTFVRSRDLSWGGGGKPVKPRG